VRQHILRLLIEWSQVRVLLGEPLHLSEIVGIYGGYLQVCLTNFLVGGTLGAQPVFHFPAKIAKRRSFQALIYTFSTVLPPIEYDINHLTYQYNCGIMGLWEFVSALPIPRHRVIVFAFKTRTPFGVLLIQ
jgi:hypothetical protein